MVWRCPRGHRGSLRRGEAGEFESQPMHTHSPDTGTISPKKLSQALETRGSHVAQTPGSGGPFWEPTAILRDATLKGSACCD